METSCPHDRHERTLVDRKRLTCGVKDCRCAECHRAVTEQEAKRWAGE